MWKHVTAAAAIACMAVAFAATGTEAQGPLGRSLRVGCQMGKPPFSDAHERDVNATLCDGLFADLFYLAMERMGQPYTMTMIDEENIDPYVTVDNATNTSQFDMFIAYQTVTPTRLATYDFSISMYQTQYRAGVLPSFHKSPAGLQSAVVRDSVWYLLAVVSTMALALTLIIWVAESFHPDSELMQMPRWRRGLTSAEAGFETMMSGSTSLAISSQISRTMRAIFAIMGMFVVCIFGAVITSQLTADSASQKHAVFDDVRGTRVAHALPGLHAWLQAELGTQVVEVPDIETFADEFYRGGQPGYSGFIAESDVTAFLHNLHGGKDNGYTVTEEFTHHGSVDLKAFPWSRQLPKTWRDGFNVQLELMREDGELATLTNREVSRFTFPVADDITVPKDSFIAIRAVAITLYCVFVAIGIGFFVIDKATALPAKDEEDGEKYTVAPAAGSFVWRGKLYTNAPAELLPVLDAIMASSDSTQGHK